MSSDLSLSPFSMSFWSGSTGFHQEFQPTPTSLWKCLLFESLSFLMSWTEFHLTFSENTSRNHSRGARRIPSLLGIPSKKTCRWQCLGRNVAVVSHLHDFPGYRFPQPAQHPECPLPGPPLTSLQRLRVCSTKSSHRVQFPGAFSRRWNALAFPSQPPETADSISRVISIAAAASLDWNRATLDTSPDSRLCTEWGNQNGTDVLRMP